MRFYFTCVSEGDQEEYDDVKNSNEDERNLLVIFVSSLVSFINYKIIMF